jgi:CRP/FNR family cyclic AMP-dependent transcriptional regulator
MFAPMSLLLQALWARLAPALVAHIPSTSHPAGRVMHQAIFLPGRLLVIQQTPQADDFKRKLRRVLERETLNSCAINVSRHANVYASGEQNDTIYFIDSGRIKLMMRSRAGKECLLAILSDGDIFGELSLSGIGTRSETATAMKTTILKQVHCAQFFTLLSRALLFEEFVGYLAMRVADQQHVIANLVTVDSEQRLGQTLLQLARTLGKKYPKSIRIELKISHEELSEMVGTTRPRISMFMQRFHHLGLVKTNKDHFFLFKLVWRQLLAQMSLDWNVPGEFAVFATEVVLEICSSL